MGDDAGGAEVVGYETSRVVEGDTIVILNVAVAGNWPGFEVDDSQFPNEMLVDYIRVIK